jgi:streptogramin lyase
VKIPIERLKPEAVYQVGGHPDWLAIDEAAWVSNEPNDNVSRLDPKTSNATTIALGAGKHPCSGLAIGFGSLWVPNCGDQTMSRLDLKTNAITATVPMTIGDSEGGIATGAGIVWLMIIRMERWRASILRPIKSSPKSPAIGSSAYFGPTITKRYG